MAPLLDASRRPITNAELPTRTSKVCEPTLPICGTRNRRNAKQLRADGASPGASPGIANAKLQVGGGVNELGRLDSNSRPSLYRFAWRITLYMKRLVRSSAAL
jgi:hypothetical protein